MTHERVVIVGAGHAGGRAAEALRQNGYPGAITLIGAEPEPPYERPPLSKAVLLGKAEPESTYLHERAFYSRNGIELQVGSCVRTLRPHEHEVVLGDGSVIAYAKLLLCTGSRARLLPGLHSLPPGIHYLRTLADCLALAKELQPGRRLVAVGGGFIGLEIASSALERGLHVTVVEQKDTLLDRVVPSEIGAEIERLHRSRGVDVRLRSTVAQLHGTSRVEAVTLSDGITLPVDVMVIGIGVVPNIELAQFAGADCGDGVVVDEYCRTSLPDVYAAGDVTNHPNPILNKRLRLESWQNAQNQAIAAAKSMLGVGAPHAEVPWFWSDQLGQNIQILGAAGPDTRIHWRGERGSDKCVALGFEGERLVSAVAFNAPRELRFVRKLIESRANVAPEVVCDPSTELKELAVNASLDRGTTIGLKAAARLY